MAVAVLPAAGASRRMGRPKLLLPVGDTTLVGAVAASLRRAAVSPIVLVTAPDANGGALRDWARGAGIEGLRVAVNPAPERGMLSTIREGIAALGGAADLAERGEILLVTPADLPGLRPESVRQLLHFMVTADGTALAVPVHRGRRGHPLAIAPFLIPEIGELDPDVGLRQLLDRHADEVIEVEMDDPGVVEDVDTPEDYARLGCAS
ncbi:MAG TPA: nucleotidyltransferase family protein [Thermoanaerobaculia bacterium]|nr:nucleotidyltransferase family protein [Thermoanaerobaculia bacterium]